MAGQRSIDAASGELLRAARDCCLTLARSFILLSPHQIDGAPEPVADGGFLFDRAAERA